MKKNFFFLSGLPRSGSTLLSAILSQNEEIHAEGNSALCQLMWDAQQSCRTTAWEQLAANNRFEKTQNKICSNLPNVYYEDVQAKYVLDKCRSWTLPDNMQMINDYITTSPKIIVLVRPIEYVVRSFMQLFINNGIKDFEVNNFLNDWSEPVMRSYNGVIHAKENNSGQFLFVDYDCLITDTKNQIKRIYDFFEIDLFEHDFCNIKNKHQENDDIYGLQGQHSIRESISKRSLDYVLPDDVLKKCLELTKQLYLNLQIGN